MAFGDYPINKNYGVGTLTFGCRKLTVQDLLQFSSQKLCGKILVAFKWFLTGKGLYATDEGLQDLLQKNELYEVILEKYPKLNNLLTIHHMVIDIFEKQKIEKKPEAMPPELAIKAGQKAQPKEPIGGNDEKEKFKGLVEELKKNQRNLHEPEKERSCTQDTHPFLNL